MLLQRLLVSTQCDVTTVFTDSTNISLSRILQTQQLMGNEKNPVDSAEGSSWSLITATFQHIPPTLSLGQM